MKAAFSTVMAMGLGAVVLLCSGCATGYWADRGRDAADVFTLTLGIGAGVKGRVGPLQVAAIDNTDVIGLRAGQWLSNCNAMDENSERYSPFPISSQARPQARTENMMGPRVRRTAAPWWRRSYGFGRELFKYGVRSPAAFRGKQLETHSPLPIWVVDRSPAFYTQIEVSGGLLFTGRVGFNVGELLDFLLGWTALDIYDDDLSRGADHRLPLPPLPSERSVERRSK